MEAIVQNYLNEHSMTLQKIANISGVAVSTLATAFNKPIESWSVRIVNAISRAVGETPSDVLRQLQPETYHLELDDDKLIIQGVQFDDEYTYSIVRNATLSNVFEGWEPNTQDILRGKLSLTAPDPEIEAHYNAVLRGEA